MLSCKGSLRFVPINLGEAFQSAIHNYRLSRFTHERREMVSLGLVDKALSCRLPSLGVLGPVNGGGGVIDLTLQALNRQAPSLDLGYGRGRHSRSLAKQGFRGYGLDLFKDRLNLWLQRSNAQDRTDPRFIQPDMRLLPFQPHSFGLILLMDTTSGIFDDTTSLQLLQGVRRLSAEKVVKDLGKSGRWRGSLLRRYYFDQGSDLLYDQLWTEDEEGLRRSIAIQN